ncbi:uncharacterized protein with GYD domain [Nocardia caishijiensis]|uniref:Uncharacterized protein with GYD domain n=1 Tax=Nocardia caishijiensis TaxID=184756 RepID=A0ABQ6YLN0_9NOCA|nr:uncharacterized protein with GYD domain [Nocardia caishijiensis]
MGSRGRFVSTDCPVEANRAALGNGARVARVSYFQEGAQGLLAQGGSARRGTITEMVESVVGSVESCYFAFGEDDLFVIGDVPDDVAAAALAIRTAATGAAISHTVRFADAGSDR